MEEQKTNTAEEQMEPTSEQLREMREKRVEFIDERLESLKKEREYQILIADVEEAKYRRLMAITKSAEILYGQSQYDEPEEQPGKEPEEQPQDNGPSDDPSENFGKPRRLKREED